MPLQDLVRLKLCVLRNRNFSVLRTFEGVSGHFTVVEISNGHVYYHECGGRKFIRNTGICTVPCRALGQYLTNGLKVTELSVT